MNTEQQIARHEHAASLYRESAARADNGTDRAFYGSEAQRNSDAADKIRSQEGY